MLKYVVLFTIALCSVQSQRPSYAGTSNRLPAVLPQYLDEQAAVLAGQASQVTQQIPPVTADGAIVNRIDGDGVNVVVGTVAPTLSATTSAPMIPLDLPVDAHGDIDLVNRIKTWPREKQPFWYINWQAIQAHRGDANNTAQPAQTQPNTRSFFAGRRRRSNV